MDFKLFSIFRNEEDRKEAYNYFANMGESYWFEYLAKVEKFYFEHYPVVDAKRRIDRVQMMYIWAKGEYPINDIMSPYY